VMDWHARMHARPGSKAAFEMPDHLRGTTTHLNEGARA
jgi:hypothetical protein